MAELPGGVVIEDRTYPVTPASMTVKCGIITGELRDLKVTERVEKGSDRVVSPAKLTGTLRLENMSANRAVHLVESKFLFIDSHGQPIKPEAAQADRPVTFTYGREQLDPGRDSFQAVGVEVPVEALQANKLKDPPGNLISRLRFARDGQLVVSIGAGT
jgi:hypothetical protein